MPLPGKNPLPQRVVAAWPLLAGVVVGFLACCLAGRVLARVNCLGDFRRLHFAVDFRTLYYPTVSQVRSLGRERLDPKKIVVVLGGNSVLLGHGQGAADNWTLRLQELLGTDFQVLNLALASGWPFEFGSVAAEVLSRDFPRLLFVTNTWPVPGSPAGEPDGRPLARYLFWQAQARSLLIDHPERDDALRRLGEKRGEPFFELRRQCDLDARLNFHDLWNAVAYRCASTVWCPLLTPSWTRPRCAYPDLNPALPPAEQRQLDASAPEVLSVMRSNALLARASLPPPDPTGWREPDSPLPQAIRECLPPSLRDRTLVLITRACPYYEQQLTPDERHWYHRSFAATTRVFAREGVWAAEVGRCLSVRHYADFVHLTAEGGRILAAEAAPLIRDLAERVGYLPRTVGACGARATTVEGRQPPACPP